MTQQFIPLGDVKKTIEKIEKEKPSLAERITVERPGKPTPATFLEENKKPRGETGRRRKSTSKKTKDVPVKIEEAKKDSILIITEKPQAAQKIALALGSSRKYSEDGVSYFELERKGEKILVASAVGHLFNLEYKVGKSLFDQ